MSSVYDVDEEARLNDLVHNAVVADTNTIALLAASELSGS